MKDISFTEHILGNVTLRNRVSVRLYLLDFSMLVGLGEGDSAEEIEDIRQKENSFC